MYILGINSHSHDSSASLLKDGEIIASIEEERLNREKHSSRFPSQAIRKCLEIGGISIQEVDHFTYFFKPWLECTGNIRQVLRYLPQSVHHVFAPPGGDSRGFLSKAMRRRTLSQRLKSEFGLSEAPEIHCVEHHLAHAASAFFVSEFQEAAIITWDGRGERAATLMSRGRARRIEKLEEIFAPHSLGHFYGAITDYLGFRPFLDEWKVMGMSAYGTDRFVKEFRELIRLEERGRYSLALEYFRFHTHGLQNWLSPRFISRFGPPRAAGARIEQRHYDIAYALQRVVEEAGVHVAKDIYERTHLPTLCMTGGVALNVLLNQKIVEETPFERFFIQPIASDAGTSVGSALYYYHQIAEKDRTQVFDSPYLGPGYTDDEIEAALRTSGARYVRCERIEEEVAREIFNGKIVGWFQGRMEAGPRALGNRSIVVNPMDPKMKDRLNARVKKREAFRPFAPSVLEEKSSEYFELPKGQLSPYMILSGRVRPEKRTIIPAVTHADGTARVHTVSRRTNPRYWTLIQEFEKLSGVPVVLNTSFNENEPIVCTPLDALNCFFRTELDVLGIGNFFVTKEESRSE